MSQIGKKPIVISEGVEVSNNKNLVLVKGELGSLEYQFNSRMKIDISDGVITISRTSDEKEERALHGLTRSLINNMIIGVSKGYEKK